MAPLDMTSLYAPNATNPIQAPHESASSPTSFIVSSFFSTDQPSIVTTEYNEMRGEGDLLSILEEEEKEIRLLQQRLQERKAKLQNLKKNLKTSDPKVEPLKEATKHVEILPAKVEGMTPRIEITVPSSPDPNHNLTRPTLDGTRKPSIDWATQVEDYEQEQKALRSALKGSSPHLPTGILPVTVVSSCWPTRQERSSKLCNGSLEPTKEKRPANTPNTNVSFLTEHIFPDGGPRKPNNQRDWNPAEIIYSEWRSGERKDKKRQGTLVYRIEGNFAQMKEKELAKLKFQMPTTEFKELALKGVESILPADFLSTATGSKIRTVLQPMVDWLNYYAAYARTVVGIKKNEKDQNERYRNFGKPKPGQPSWKLRAEKIETELSDAIRFNEELCAFIYILKEIGDTKKDNRKPTPEVSKDTRANIKDSTKGNTNIDKQDTSTKKKNKGKQVGRDQTPVKPRIILKNPNSPQEIGKVKAASEVLQVISQNAEEQQEFEDATDISAQLPSTPQSTTDSIRRKLTKSQKAKAKKLANANSPNGFVSITDLEIINSEKGKNGKKQGDGSSNGRLSTPKSTRAPLPQRELQLASEGRRQIDKAQLERLQCILRTDDPALEGPPAKGKETNAVTAAVIVCDGNVDSPVQNQCLSNKQDARGESKQVAKVIESSRRRNSIELKPSYGPWAEKNSWRSSIPDKSINATQLHTVVGPAQSKSLDPSAKPFTFEPQSSSLPKITATSDAEPTAPDVSTGPNDQRSYNTVPRTFAPRTERSFTSLKAEDLRTRKPIIVERNRLKNDLTQAESTLSTKILHICSQPNSDDPEWYDALDIDISTYEEATWSLQRKIIQTLERLDMLASYRVNLADPLLKQINQGKNKEQLSVELASLKQVVQDAQGDIATKKTLWIAAKDNVEKFKKSEDKRQKNAVLRDYMWRKEDWIEAARYWSGTLGPLLRGRIDYCEKRFRGGPGIW